VLVTTLLSSTLIDRITHYLEDRLAPRTQVHGVLLDVYGLGVLIRGDSGIGKSEAALDLVVRGHRLVADDVVQIRRVGNNVLMGTGPEILRHHMELRGLGIINIKDLFGVAAVRNEKAIDLVVDLSRWDERQHYDRLGLDSDRVEILDVALPLLRMPVAPGRNMAILVEVASRNHLLVVRGYHAARELIRKVQERRPGEEEGA
jgi:HPr kinase/phosphorylase